MHRVLQPLHELLELCDASLEHSKAILPTVDAWRRFLLISRFGTTANLPDPRDQSLKLGHSSPPARTFGRNRAARIPPTFFLRHLADHQRPALDLLAHELELRLALLRRSLLRALQLATSRRVTIEPNLRGPPDSCLEVPASAIDPDAPRALTT